MTGAGLGAPPGLCGTCANAVLNATRRGPVYLRCGLAATDPRFRRYPTLPVRACPGYEPGTSATRCDPAG